MEKIPLWLKCLLFFSAYSPFFLILFIKNENMYFEPYSFWVTLKYWAVLIPFLLSLLSTIIFLCFLNFLNKKTASNEYKVINYKDLADRSMSYILTYIIPFLNFDLTNGQDILCIYIFLFLICVIYINTDLIYTNPLLYVFQYSVIEAKLSNYQNNIKTCILLVKNQNKFQIKQNILIDTILLNNSYMNLMLYKEKDMKRG